MNVIIGEIRLPKCKDLSCPDVYQPVCGSDYITYPNECVMGIENCFNPFANITKLYNGECGSDS
jgi:hypothetical protein